MMASQQLPTNRPAAVPHAQSTSDMEALIILPTPNEHRQSFVVLHGRGSNGKVFGQALVTTALPSFDDRTLPQIFPHAKFIFPTAPRRRAQLYKRALTHQWFDNWDLTTPTECEELQFQGLLETSCDIHRLLRTEIEAVGHKNVILWGLSQGCAASLVTLLLSGPEEKVAAVVGMCGWLPLRARMEAEANADHGGIDLNGNDDDDPFETDEDKGDQPEKSKLEKVVRYLEDEIDFPRAEQDESDRNRTQAILKTPIFLGHGTEDDRVSIRLGQEAAGLLQSLDLDVRYRSYDGLGHWYSAEMLSDIVNFIHEKVHWRIERSI